MSDVPNIYDLDKLLNNKNWKLINYTSKYLTEPGDNYGSEILSIKVVYVEDKVEKYLELVAKLCPKNELLKQAFLSDVTFKKEAFAYLQACPTITKFQEDHNIFLNTFPVCFGARINNQPEKMEVDNDAVILLENLKSQGFLMENRMKGFEMKISKIIIQHLAVLHASVIAIRLTNSELFNTKIMPSLKSVNSGSVMIKGFLDAALKFLKSINDCKDYYPKIVKMINDRKRLKGLKFPIISNRNFYTIVHTDLWTNNVMIHNNFQIKFIDLQLLDFGSPIRDLLFFLYTSVNQEILDENFWEFISHYYKCFSDALKLFKCYSNDFSFDNFMKELNLVAPHELYHILFMLKPIFTERKSVQNLETINEKNFENTDNLGDTYLQRLRKIILSYASNNWLNDV